VTIAARLDEMVTLYTVSGLTVREIAQRFDAEPLTVKMMLGGAGVDFAKRGQARPPEPPPIRESSAPPPSRKPRGLAASVMTRKPMTAQAARTITRMDADRREDMEDANAKHVRAVVRALNGKGFPFLQIGSAK
jgi:transposase-like protein